MKNNRTTFIIVAIVAVALIGFLAVKRGHEEGGARVFFSCASDKGIRAKFGQQKVSLELSNGREITLSQTVSGSGARYANADQSFVFWNKGQTAFIEENGTTTYRDCTVTP